MKTFIDFQNREVYIQVCIVELLGLDDNFIIRDMGHVFA